MAYVTHKDMYNCGRSLKYSVLHKQGTVIECHKRPSYDECYCSQLDKQIIV